MVNHQERILIAILRKEVVLSLGCTEPVAVALAAAWAARAAGDTVEAISISVDKNIYKNGLCVGIPGTGEVGLSIAAASGAVAGNPDLGLEVLRSIDQEQLAKAKLLVESGQVSVKVEPTAKDIYVEAVADTAVDRGAASIRYRHDNVIAVTCNGQDFEGFPTRDQPSPPVLGGTHTIAEPLAILQYELTELVSFCQNVSIEEISFLQRAIDVNLKFARQSMARHDSGVLGSRFQDLMDKGLVSADFLGKTKHMVASAVEARMEGLNRPVMSCAGSGNQGLIATLPVVVAADFNDTPDDRRLRAAALSYLITIYVKAHMGVLTPVCGGNVAGGMGACCGITYLFGGELPDIERAIKNTAGSVMGVICDGAKLGCAFKASMAVGMAVDNALLALEGVNVPTGDGIVDESADQTIRNMGYVTMSGMANTDDAILNVMGRGQK